MSFMDQIAECRKSVKRDKKTVPWLFREWQELEAARDALNKAKERVQKARKAWRELGEPRKTTPGKDGRDGN
jgi:FtsZ-binding cell division protein ZapB